MSSPINNNRQSAHPRAHSRTRSPTPRRAPCGDAATSGTGIARAKNCPQTTIKTASPQNCHTIEIPNAAHPAPSPAPMTAPADQAACNSGINVRPSARSTADPSTLIITSSAPMLNPTITKPTAVTGSECARPAPTPIPASPTATRHNTPRIPPRAPNRDRIAVVAPSPASEPTVTPASTAPITPSSTARSARRLGSRGPHVDSVIPPRANAAITALRHGTSSRRSATVVTGWRTRRRRRPTAAATTASART